MYLALFDQFNIPFVYEPFGQHQFPDFYFPSLGTYGEVKPDINLRDNPWNDPTIIPEWIRLQPHYSIKSTNDCTWSPVHAAKKEIWQLQRLQYPPIAE
jgi:hypothetical protein